MFVPLKNLEINDEMPGSRVRITDGILKGRDGVIDSLSDEAVPTSLLIELDGDGGNVWIHVYHLSIELTPNAEKFAERAHILKRLEGCAEYDMRKARGARDNEIAITQTLRGLVALAYDRATQTYSLTTQDGGSWTATGKRAAIKRELINLYQVIEQEEERAEAA